MDVRIKDLRKYFPRTKAVDGISFEFSSGDIFGFVGPNGAGKTTTMRVLATLDEPTSGDATIDGVSVVQEPERARRNVGFMPDSLPAHRDMTVREYLEFFASAYGIRGAKRTKIVESVEDFTNLGGIREKTLRALSKGMKQRVSLARAMVHNPPVMVLDEPAAGLDPRARVELRELLKALAQQGKAILISSHILTELSEICNGAVIIEQGRILRAGSMEEIFSAQDASGGATTAACRKYSIRPLDGVEALYRMLLEIPIVRAARIVGPEVEVELADSGEESGQLLSMLVARGVRIAEFRQKQLNLEDVFMSVTKGNVQ
jgi:ABC-2 type transport system ATP-binding protein